MKNFLGMRALFSTMLIVIFTVSLASAEGWKENPYMFNPSGVPSLPFSQPRFADLDGDGDLDLILGSMSDKPYYMVNVGNAKNPKFTHLDDIFANVSSLEAEVAVFHDLDGDGKLDMICGGFSGLFFYRNVGHAVDPVFEKVPGFFDGLEVGHYPVPDLADVDNDGDLDLLIGMSEDGSVRVYFNTGNDTAAVFSESNSQLIGNVGLYAYPVFCDLDNDGDYDILCGRDGLGFYYYKNTGTPSSPSWQRNDALFAGIANNSYFNSPVIADLNGDGKPDLIYGTADGPLIYYINTGTESSPKWTKNNSLFGGVLNVGGASSPFFVDLDGDGDLDLVTGTNMGDIKYYENVGTATAPAWKSTPGTFSKLKHSMYSSASLADVTGDGLLDAIVGDYVGNIYYHENSPSGFDNKNYLTIASLGGWSSPRFVDLDGDGDYDIVSGCEEGYLHYFENIGTPTSPLWTERKDFFGGIRFGRYCVPAFADLDFDGDLDLIVGLMFREVRYFENRDWTWVEDTSMVSGIVCGQNAAPAFADLDGDGDMDLILGSYDGNFSYYENTREVVSVKDKALLPDDFNLYAYPNPFNPQTMLHFELPQGGLVNIGLYDLSGRLLMTLIQNYREAGTHFLRLRATGDMPSGIYFLRMSVDAKTAATHKLLFLK